MNKTDQIREVAKHRREIVFNLVERTSVAEAAIQLQVGKERIRQLIRRHVEDAGLPPITRPTVNRNDIYVLINCKTGKIQGGTWYQNSREANKEAKRLTKEKGLWLYVHRMWKFGSGRKQGMVH